MNIGRIIVFFYNYIGHATSTKHVIQYLNVFVIETPQKPIRLINANEYKGYLLG